MPVAVRLSRNFYDRFGDDATNELVTLLNDVDLTYRSELKEVNAHNFVLFDAKLDQRFAEQDAKLEKRFAEQDAKFEKRFAEQDAKFEKRFAAIDLRFAEIRGEMKELQSHLVRWMFAFWVASTATTIAALSAFAR